MSTLLNKKKLAEALGRSPGYISAMIKAGYRMRYGMQTSLPHALPGWRRSEFSRVSSVRAEAEEEKPNGGNSGGKVLRP